MACLEQDRATGNLRAPTAGERQHGPEALILRRKSPFLPELGPGSLQGTKGESHLVTAGRHGDRTEQNIGTQKRRRLVVKVGVPPGVPHVVEDSPAAVGAVDLQHHIGILIGDNAGLTAPSRAWGGHGALEEDRRRQIDGWPLTVA